MEYLYVFMIAMFIFAVLAYIIMGPKSDKKQEYHDD